MREQRGCRPAGSPAHPAPPCCAAQKLSLVSATLATTNGQWAQGDALPMAASLGAQLVHLDQVQVHPTGERGACKDACKSHATEGFGLGACGVGTA